MEGTGIPSTNEKTKAFIGQGEKRFSGKAYSRHGRVKSKKNDKCLYCGKYGHWKRECRRLEVDKKNASKGLLSEETGRNGTNNGEGYYAQVFYVNEFSSTEQIGSDINEHNKQLSADLNTATWIVDSGASNHLCNDKSMFRDIDYSVRKEVFLGDNRSVQSMGMGTIRVLLNGNNKYRTPVEIQDVWYVPNLACNLLSVNQLVQKGYRLTFSRVGCEIVDEGGILVSKIRRKENLWILQNSIATLPNGQALTTFTEGQADLWHKRLGHISKDAIRILQNRSLLGAVKYSKTINKACESCVEGKQHRVSFPPRISKSSEPLQLIHSDLYGPMRTTSKGGAEYFVLFMDDFSRYSFVYFLRKKNEALDAFRKFKTLVENQLGRRIRKLRTDNGGEYTGDDFENCLSEHGIIHETSLPYTPQQNGVSERMNRTVVEMARTLLIHSNLHASFWVEAVNTAIYLRNRSPSSSIENNTPYQNFYGKLPTLSYIRVFGCKCYAKVLNKSVHKWSNKTEKCVLMGYSETSKAYRLWSLEKEHIIESIDVVFDELSTIDAKRDHLPETQQRMTAEDELFEYTPALEEAVIDPLTYIPEQEFHVQTTGDSVQYRYPTRQRNAPERYDPSGNLARANVAQIQEPTSVEDALTGEDSENWRTAMNSEMSSLKQNGTWDITQLPAGRKSVGCRWIFKVKYNVDGTIEKYKARLVAKGYSQVEGTDYFETFAPVCKFASLRCLLAIAAIQDMEVHQMDVKTAFLNGDLKEEVYMMQPPGYENGNPRLVCRLSKAIYGLKQVPRAWYAKLSNLLRSMNFTPIEADHGIFVTSFGEARN